MLDFRVHTFLAVCRHMNYTKAAEELHITQPAVSQHIRYLETLYGVRLFVSEGKKVHLSPAGERLLQAATTLKNDEAYLKELLSCVPEQGPLVNRSYPRPWLPTYTGIRTRISGYPSAIRTSFSISFQMGISSLPWWKGIMMSVSMIHWYTGPSRSSRCALPVTGLSGNRNSLRIFWGSIS